MSKEDCPVGCGFGIDKQVVLRAGLLLSCFPPVARSTKVFDDYGAVIPLLAPCGLKELHPCSP